MLSAEIDKDQNHKVSFIEWACAMFAKDWEALFAELEVEVEVSV